jgi:glycosyltransferase involved in cell wall biosynthesis
MTRVMHVISGLDTGGAEAFLVQLAAGLKVRGFEQEVVSVTTLGANAAALQSSGIGVHALNVGSLAGAMASVGRLAALVRRAQPDVLQGWMYYGDMFTALANQMVPGKRRLFWNLRASDTVEGGYGRLVRINAKLSGWPDIVIANSQSGLDFHRAQGYRPRRTEVIPNGVNTGKFRPDRTDRTALRAELGLPEDALVAIHVARVNPMKDHATFLKAMQALPQMRGLLVGAGTETLELPGNVGALGLRTDVERLYRCADIVVSSSAFAEGFSNVLAEGMSSGLVPVATDVGDARMIVGDTGRLVAIRDPVALANALAAEAQRSDRDDRKARARARMVENFTLDRAIERFAKLYESDRSSENIAAAAKTNG